MFTYMMGKPLAADVVLPANAILPLYGAAAVPSGWSAFTAANGRAIIGAGADFAPAAAGGGGALTVWITNPGDHTVAWNGFRGGPASWAGLTADGAHSHVGSSVTPDHPYQALRLMQLTAESAVIPQNGTMLFHSGGVPGALTKWSASASDVVFEAGAASGSGGSASAAVSIVLDGEHNHDGTEGGSVGGSQGGNWKGGSPGTHLHTATLTITFNCTRRTMHMGYAASSSVNINDFDNPIILYPSITPPAGWALCDGNNGTPDMQYYMIEITTMVASPGVAYGDGTISAPGVTSDTSPTHDHDNGSKCGDCKEDNAWHAALGGASAHTVSLPSSVWQPAYYGLAFMMKT
jgi:hypothetical protein